MFEVVQRTLEQQRVDAAKFLCLPSLNKTNRAIWQKQKRSYHLCYLFYQFFACFASFSHIFQTLKTSSGNQACHCNSAVSLFSPVHPPWNSHRDSQLSQYTQRNQKRYFHCMFSILIASFMGTADVLEGTTRPKQKIANVNQKVDGLIPTGEPFGNFSNTKQKKKKKKENLKPMEKYIKEVTSLNF